MIQQFKFATCCMSSLLLNFFFQSSERGPQRNSLTCHSVVDSNNSAGNTVSCFIATHRKHKMILRTVNLLLSSVLVALSLGDNCMDIGAFNIQVFGRTKMSNPDVVHSLVKVHFLILFEVDYSAL